MRPATFFAGVLFIAVCVAGTIVKLAKREAWNWIFDRDTRNILPPQYLIQFPRGYVMAGQFHGNYDDDPKHAIMRTNGSWRRIPSTRRLFTFTSQTGAARP